MISGTSDIKNVQKVTLTLLLEELSKEFELYLGVDDEAIPGIWWKSTNWRLKLPPDYRLFTGEILDFGGPQVDIKSFQECFANYY